MAGVLGAVLGTSVSWTPHGGSATDIDAIFREDPVAEADDQGREILVTMPSLRVQRPAAVAIARGDIVEPGNGKTYRILNKHPSGSPASDAFVLFELEILT